MHIKKGVCIKNKTEISLIYIYILFSIEEKTVSSLIGFSLR